MKEIEEIIKHKEATGKTYEELAREMNVSVFTVNDWFNRRSCSRISQKKIRVYLQKMSRQEARK